MSAYILRLHEIFFVVFPTQNSLMNGDFSFRIPVFNTFFYHSKYCMDVNAGSISIWMTVLVADGIQLK